MAIFTHLHPCKLHTNIYSSCSIPLPNQYLITDPYCLNEYLIKPKGFVKMKDLEPKCAVIPLSDQPSIVWEKFMYLTKTLAKFTQETLFIMLKYERYQSGFLHYKAHFDSFLCTWFINKCYLLMFQMHMLGRVIDITCTKIQQRWTH